MATGNLALIQEMDPAQVFSLTGDRRIQSVISKLRFLAKIKRGEKMNTRELFVRDNDSVVQRFLRTLRNWSTVLSASDVVESKEATLEFIETAVNEAITLIAFYQRDSQSFSQSIATIIAQNLEESKDGIHESIETYKHDRKFISEAESIMQTLEARVNSLRQKGFMQVMTDKPFMPITVLKRELSPPVQQESIIDSVKQESVIDSVKQVKQESVVKQVKQEIEETVEPADLPDNIFS